jgi:small subunit ribosomal protein S6
MQFDAAAPVQAAIQRTLGLDPRMIRFSVVKVGDKLEEIKDVDGRIEWNESQNQSLTDAVST